MGYKEGLIEHDSKTLNDGFVDFYFVFLKLLLIKVLNPELCFLEVYLDKIGENNQDFRKKNSQMIEFISHTLRL